MSKPADLPPDDLLAQATCAVLIDGKVKGTAWLVSDEGHLLTAGHLLGTDKPRGDVEVRFAEDIPRKAYKVQWGYQGEMGIDFAVLKLTAPPPNRRPLPISLAREVEGTFRERGYGVALHDQSVGKGQFVGAFDPQNSPGNRLFELDSKQLGEAGYSGAAVFSDELQAVVAVQIEATKASAGPGRDAILAMPLYRIDDFWPELTRPGQVKSPKAKIFPFLFPFHADDKDIFFGRDKDISELIERIERDPIVIVNGMSGCGKTSLIRAGVVPRLHGLEKLVIYTRVSNSLIGNIQSEAKRVLNVEKMPEDWVDFLLQGLHSRSGEEIVLIVDQFEQALSAAYEGQDLKRFMEGIDRLAVEAGELVTIVIVVRADWLYFLETAVRRISPNLITHGLLVTLFPLTKEAAYEAITRPLEKAGLPFDGGVIEEILNSLLRSSVNPSLEFYIQPIQLQIVLRALLSVAEEAGTAQEALTMKIYRRSGGVESILRNYLVDSLGNRHETWQLLARFVAQDGKTGRAIHRSELLAVPAAEGVEHELKSLIGRGFLEAYEAEDVGETFYRLAHDYLVNAIVEYLNKNPDKQGWKLAEDWLASGTLEWGKDGLLLEKDRYVHIYQYKDRLKLTDASRELLIRTALRYGHEGLGDWLFVGLLQEAKLQKADLPTEVAILFSSQAGERQDGRRETLRSIRESLSNDTYQELLDLDVPIVVSELLSPESETRTVAHSAMSEAVRRDLLTDEHRKCLKASLWQEFEGKKADKEQPTRPDTAQLTRTERKRAIATYLWTLKDSATLEEKLKFVPIAARAYVADHKRLIIVSVASVLFTIMLVLTFWGIRESLRGKWYPVHSSFAGPVSAAAIPLDKPDIYIVTQRPTIVEDRATLLWSQGDDDWKILSRNFIHYPVSSLLVTYRDNKPRIYVSVRGRGILRSDNNGRSWELINTGLRSYDIIVLVADPLNPDVIYAGSGDKRGIFHTLDGGNTWQDISEEDLFGATVFSIVYTPYEGGTFLAGTEDGRILARKRNEPTWQLVSAYPGIGAILQMSAEPEKGQHIYAGTSNGNVLVSPDGGASWVFLKRIPGVFSINSIAVVPGKPNVVYMDAFGIGGHIVWKSEDNGQNWRHVSDNQFSREEIRWLLIPRGEPGKLYAAGRAGFFETQDGGNSWIFHSSAGSLLAPVYNIAISPFDDGPIYASVGGAIYASSDPQGKVWKRGHGLLAEDVRDIVSDPNTAAIAYAGVYLPGKWSVFVTMDGGETWQPTSRPPNIPARYLNDTMALDIAQIHGGTILYAGTNGCGVMHTTDRGASWETWGRQDCLLPENAPKNIQDLVIDPHLPNRLYVAADDARFFVTEDRGQTWQSYPTQLTTEITVLEVDAEIEGRVYLIAGAEGFWRSDDGGKTWKPYSKRLEGRALSAMVMASDAAETLFVGATSGEVWKTTDGGQNWTSVRENLAVTDISILTSRSLNAGLLLGSARDGIYQYQPGSLSALWD